MPPPALAVPEVRGRKVEENLMHQIKIDVDKCTGCKQCYKTCYVDVFRWDEARERPIATYPEECATCNWCEITCPKNAIEVVPDYHMPYPRYYPKILYPGTYEE